MPYRFGEFVLDDGTRQLTRGGREVPLGPKAFELLELLVRSRPRVLSRTRLGAALWPGTHVGPTSLHVLVSQVRTALGDDPLAPQFIRTVQRVGYAFRGDATDDGPPAGLEECAGGHQLIFGKSAFRLQEGENTLGRHPGIAVPVKSPGVSRHHARIVVRGSEAMLEDLASKNGTFVGEERVTRPRPLRDGDVVGLGKRARLAYRAPAGERTESESR